MVPSWLAAHRDHVPTDEFQKRVEEWTPDVSAAGTLNVVGLVSASPDQLF